MAVCCFLFIPGGDRGERLPLLNPAAAQAPAAHQYDNRQLEEIITLLLVLMIRDAEDAAAAAAAAADDDVDYDNVEEQKQQAQEEEEEAEEGVAHAHDYAEIYDFQAAQSDVDFDL